MVFSKSRLLIIVLIFVITGIGGGFLLKRNAVDSGNPPASISDHYSGQPLPGSGLRERQQVDPNLAPAHETMDASAAGGNLANLQNKMRRDSNGLVPVEVADKHVMVHLQGRFTHMSTGVQNVETGELIIQCFTDFDKLKDSISGTRQPLEEESWKGEVADY